MQPKKKQGFAALAPEEHKEASSKGGQKSGPKGFASLTPEERSANASNASRARWNKVKEAKQNVKPSSED